MKIERVRSILGVWAPMAIGLFIIVTSINFYFTARLAGGPFLADFESWRLICSAGAFFVGGVLLLSTYGRYRKTKEARREGRPTEPSGPAPTTADEQADHEGDRHDDQQGPQGP